MQISSLLKFPKNLLKLREIFEKMPGNRKKMKRIEPKVLERDIMKKTHTDFESAKIFQNPRDFAKKKIMKIAKK